MKILIQTLNQNFIELLNQNPLKNNRIINILPSVDSEQVQVLRFQNQYAFFDLLRFELLLPDHASDEFVLECFNEIQKSSQVLSIEAPKRATRSLIDKYLTDFNFKVYYVDLMNLEELYSSETKGIEELLVSGSNFSTDGVALIADFSRERLGKDLTLPAAEAIAKSENRDFFGIKFENEIVSIGAMTRTVFESRCISYIYTKSSHRRFGYSKLLLKYMIQSARGRYNSLFLHVDEENSAARSLYQGLGFNIIATQARIRIDVK